MSVLRRIAIAGAFALFVPGVAHAETKTLTFQTGPIVVSAYGVATAPTLAPSPAEDGYVVGLIAEVVDAQGRVQGRRKVMLHHIVIAKVGARDATCGGLTERFYAEGEERTQMLLPPGYGYANRGTDRWGLLYMLMNHTPRTLTGYVRYTVRYVVGEQLTPVKPVWLDVRNCTGPDPSFDVPGTAGRFSVYTRTMSWTSPESGFIVGAGGHLHGGGIRLELRNVTCNADLFTSQPTWGGPVPLPILHEPGPTHMSQFTSASGIPVAAGQTLRIRAVYDNGSPHTRVMGIMILYLAPGQATGCQPTPRLTVDLGHPSYPPSFTFPLPATPTGQLREEHHVEHRRRRGFELRSCRQARDDVHVGLLGHLPARRHSGVGAGRLLLAVDPRRQVRAHLHEAGHLQALLLAPPRADDADHRRALTRWRHAGEPGLPSRFAPLRVATTGYVCAWRSVPRGLRRRVCGSFAAGDPRTRRAPERGAVQALCYRNTSPHAAELPRAEEIVRVPSTHHPLRELVESLPTLATVFVTCLLEKNEPANLAVARPHESKLSSERANTPVCLGDRLSWVIQSRDRVDESLVESRRHVHHDPDDHWRATDALSQIRANIAVARALCY